MHLEHDGVAGVDAEAALDAAELRALANVDAGRAGRDALMAVDAVAGRLARRLRLGGFLQGHPRFAAVAAVADVERVDIRQRRLDARPRAHVEADLLAHEAREIIGGEGEDADPGVGGDRGLQGRQLRTRVGASEK